MVGLPFIGVIVAQVAFWILLALGTVNGSLTRVTAAIFVTLWFAGDLILPRIAWWTGAFFTPWVAILDIALVFVVNNGDVKLR